MENFKILNGIISVGILFCLIVGWFHLFSSEINQLIYSRIFYILIGTAFGIQTRLLTNHKMIYPLYGAGALCMIGAFLPLSSEFSVIKTIGILAGLIITFTNRPKYQK
ncbi:hypothetical protein [Daejeonia sp. YH14]|uniref:hypothetical protein n=1 Tax=Daejeonia sp. YH14 TaxID=3439042 RepID=UPI003F4992CB